jgi:hypothetical protein
MFVIMLAALMAIPAFAQQQAAPAASVKAVQPGLLEVTGGRVNDAVAAGIQKITAKADNSRRAIEVHSPWGNLNFAWPKGVKPVAFTIETGKAGGATISAPGFTEANKEEYRAAVDAVVTKAIKDAQAQKTAKTMKQ